MASTVWKGQLTFGLVSFAVRLVRAARKERIPLRYVREVAPSETHDEGTASLSRAIAPLDSGEGDEGTVSDAVIAPVRQAYVADEEDAPVVPNQLQRGYEVAPGQFAVVRPEELQKLRQPTSPVMQILRSVRMSEIDPVFLETSYYVVPANGGEHWYNLFYCALKESGYAALAEVAMHGRQHVVVVRPGAKGLIGHTMYYVNEVRAAEEYVADVKDVASKELDLAKRFVEAIAAPFQPEEFTDRYREQLEALIASKKALPARGAAASPQPATNVVDIMEALRKSLAKAKAEKTERKPVSAAAAPKSRRRRA